MVYAPEAPFNSGTPETVPPGVREEVRARSATVRADREAVMLVVTRSSLVVAEQVQ
jgi:hypothetical protein